VPCTSRGGDAVRDAGDDPTVKARLLALVFLGALATATAVAAAPLAKVTRTKVPAAGLSLALPTSWKRVDAQTAGQIAKETLAQENPQLAGILAELDRPGTGLVFFAFDPKGAEQFATNVNIVVSRIPAGVTLAQLVAASKSELSGIPGRVGRVTAVAATLPGGPAAHSIVDVAVSNKGKKVVARVTQYAFLRPGRSVVVSFTTRKTGSARYAPTFAAAAHSVRFG
jgi:hypothetical protein